MDVSETTTESGILAPAHAFVPFRTAAVLGAGTMGAQIAAHLANAGLDVLLLDLPAKDGSNPNALVNGAFKQIRKMKPDPFFDERAAARVRTGNFDDDIGRLGSVEWVIEAVVERIDIKSSLLARVEEVVGPDTIVSTNTSGLSVTDIASARSESFQRRFLGTHFFNPPRYLKLLELVPSDYTDPEIVARIAHFGRVHLGKGIVVANDTPYFIGNRVGVYAMLQAMRAFTDRDYTIEEVDALTGPLAGRPRSATFRTADVVGLDVMLDVARNLYAAAVDDESREAFSPPPLLESLVEADRKGQKSSAGFYMKDGREIKSVHPDTLEYMSASDLDLPEFSSIPADAPLHDRLVALYEADGRTGAFVRRSTLDLLSYSARRIPEITDRPADVDRAIRWGFGWQLGPFEMWDALGFERVLNDMKADGFDVPAWIDAMHSAGRTGFYSEAQHPPENYKPSAAAYVEDPLPADELRLDVVKSDSGTELWASDDAALLDIGEGVALFEFRSKANTLGRGVMEGLREAIDRVERDPALKGLVVGNEGRNFSVGANLMEMAEAVRKGKSTAIEAYLRGFQETIQYVHYARKPVVVAVHQRVLGGGCEMLMASSHAVASAESYVGLVELGVGLIPAGTGSMRLAAEAARRAPNGHPSEIQSWLQKFFETVAMSTVSTSAVEAQKLGFVSPAARIVMHDDRRLFVAREEVLRLAHEGYRPPSRPTGIPVLGRPTAAALEVMVHQYVEGGFISEYDAFLGARLAFVMTGGELTVPQTVDEEYLLDLERSVFLELLNETKTQDRVEHMLKTKKPLRN